ncbi:branched-chain amino acid transport system substrate-binding protein [Oxalobacteraceae bacterium GrIS 1.11]
MRSKLSVFLLCATLSGLAAAAPAAPADIVVGQSAPISGANADLGLDIRNGALAYFNKVNAHGGVRGRKISLVTLDDRNDAKISGVNAKSLVEKDGAVALFGFASSTLSIPAMPVVASAKVPFFAPFTGADTIRKQNDYVYTIRVSYSEEIDKLIGFWAPLGVTRIAVLHYDDPVGIQNFQTAAKALEQFKKTPISIAIKRNADVTDADVAKIIAANSQIVLVTTSYAPLAQMKKKLEKAGNHSMVTALSFAGASQIAKSLGESASGITVALTVPLPTDLSVPVVAECQSAWRESGQTGPVSPTALESFIAAKVLVEGMKHTNHDITRESLQESLSSLTRVDVGGFAVQFKPGFRHGGKFVDIAVILRNGSLQQ